MTLINKPSQIELANLRSTHAILIAQDQISRFVDLTLSEALIIGLLRQEVKVFFTVFGHGSTEIGEVLRIYEKAGLVKVLGVRNEIEASHAATALRWMTGEKAAVVTSIGPGALQALAASLVPASDGIGVWYLFGDETTEDEGFNMQQIPRHEQGLFLQMASSLGKAYSLHTPLSLPRALQQGGITVNHPYKPGPFFLLMPMNTQGCWMPGFNLDELSAPSIFSISAADGDYQKASHLILSSGNVVIKAGGGARFAGNEILDLLALSKSVLVHTPIATGCVSYTHPQHMGVGGSKGSLCGNFAMENADLLIAIGTRAVCQSDSSRTGYPNVKWVININADPEDAIHYNRTLALVGDIRSTLEKLNQTIQEDLSKNKNNDEPGKKKWLISCGEQKSRWQELKQQRIMHPVILDEYWKCEVLTQPAVINIASEWAKKRQIPCLFDAGDVQANGFQMVEDDLPNQTFTETGASYMGFAVSALLATAAGSKPFYALALTGDGSFTMNPQIIIDGVEHGARGCILLLDNGRMGAISGLQNDQYGATFATWNSLKVDYLSWGHGVPGLLTLDGGYTPESLLVALDQAGEYDGLSLIHIPVYFGSNPLGGLGVYGRWNVGSWCDNVQALRHLIGL